MVVATACAEYVNTEPATLPPAILQLQQEFAPDKRTDRVAISLENDTLTGYTTRRDAAANLREVAAENGYHYAVRTLPAEELADTTFGVVRVATANLRSQPGHSQELATQALYGTPLQVLDKQDDWYLVRTPDRYLAWLEEGAFRRMTKPKFKDYLNTLDLIYTGKSSAAVDAEGNTLAVIRPGAVLPNLNRIQQQQYFVDMNGQKATLTAERVAGRSLPSAEMPNVEDLLKTATTFNGQPYLWGGTSESGLDCSGFTKLTYQLNGYVIPRDASQQVHAGIAVTEDDDELQRGDLLFFGKLREDGSERITHVGFYLGDGRFLHAGADNGQIQENSLIEGAPNFSRHRLNSLLRARRLTPGSPGVVPLRKAFENLLNEG
ncbi:hypothetical protein A3850_009200 [Lewinella sp. 4G2]|nr:hypothetical protein A3850_009200 [Lewinella sp. 4G2]